ncbi:MAG: HlyD family secretion protein [Gammaproteobacteria bacterium]|nr:HlyD family secretion protein [Gammaproteobacteria bacterium]
MTEKPDSKDTETAEPKTPMDPVRKWTLIVFGAAVVLIIWYLAADRITPYSSQARVHALVVPVASEVSGTVVDVAVSNNQLVAKGDVLFQIERDRYQLVLENAQANLQKARQATGVSTAGVDAAQASVGAARAALLRSEQDATRLRRIKQQDPGAISDRRVESAEAALSASREQLAAAQANLERARQDLGETGDDNVRIVQAQAAVDQAQLDLDRTSVKAPADGLVTDVRVDQGNFAPAGSPRMTFIATHDVWVQADLTENNLGNVQRGDRVGISFDVMPGRVFEGTVRGMGYGVAVDSAPLGSLPTIKNERAWLREAQRFPVEIDFELPIEDLRKLRVGAQASVIVYTGDNFLLNGIGRVYIRLASILSYAY